MGSWLVKVRAFLWQVDGKTITETVITVICNTVMLFNKKSNAPQIVSISVISVSVVSVFLFRNHQTFLAVFIQKLTPIKRAEA